MRESGASYLAHPKPLKAVFLSVVVSGWSLSNCAPFALEEVRRPCMSRLQVWMLNLFERFFGLSSVLQSLR